METPYCLTTSAEMLSRMNRLARSRSGYSLAVEIRASLPESTTATVLPVAMIGHGYVIRAREACICIPIAGDFVRRLQRLLLPPADASGRAELPIMVSLVQIF